MLGDPALKVCALLALQPGGAVILCAALFGEVSEDRQYVENVLAEFEALPEFRGKLLAVGEFRPNPKGAPQ